MSVFIGRGTIRWPEGGPAGIRWMATAPLSGPAAYPPVLDVAEAAAGTGSALVKAARGVVAPSFETLARYGLHDATGEAATAAAAFQLEQRLERADSAMARYVAESLAEALATLGAQHGIVIRGVQHWDPVSLRFVRRLVLAARASGFNVAFDAPQREFRRRPLLRGLADGAQLVPRDSHHGDCAGGSPVLRALLALSPHGLPIDVAARVAEPDDLPRVSGPDGAPWVYLPCVDRRTAAGAMATEVRRELHRQLFDLWPGRGFGYLRRGRHPIAAQSGELLLRQHGSYLAGMAGVSLAFVHAHLAALADAARRLRLPRHEAARIASAAGQVAERLPDQRAFDRAIRHFRRALASSDDAADRVSAMCELSNACAFKRTPEGLAAARDWCELAAPQLADVEDAAERDRLAIRVANALALVEYREGDVERALELEMEARSVASRNREEHPEIESWARKLTNRNIAQLLARGFGDSEGAIGYLRENLRERQPAASREADSLAVARLSFDAGDLDGVIRTLAPLYETGDCAYDEEKELHGRALLAIALARSGELERALRQRPHLRSLGRALEAPGAERLAEALEQLAVSPYAGAAPEAGAAP